MQILKMTFNRKTFFNYFCLTCKESIISKNKDTLTVEYKIIDKFHAGQIINIMNHAVIQWSIEKKS